VGDHDDGHAEGLFDFNQKVHDAFAGGGIEIASGFVGEKNFGAIDEGAGDGGALLFAAGKFGGAVAGALVELYALKSLGNSRVAFAVIYFRETERQLDIFGEGHAREQVEGLKDHADGVAAVAGKFERRKFGEVAAIGVNGAGSGAVEACHEIEKSRFAGAGAAEERDEFAASDRKGNIVDGSDGGGAESIVAGDAVKLDGVLAGGRVCGHVGVRCALKEYYVGRGNLCRAQARAQGRGSGKGVRVHPGVFGKECASD